MTKRRRLTGNEDVILIYDTSIGFIQQSATFKEYRGIIHNNVKHEIPVFERNKEEIAGTECFWILRSDIDDDLRIEQFQRELIELQLKVLEIGIQKEIEVPEKIQDKEIRDMATENAEYRARLTQELGYDPLDYSWVERELADDSLEKDWFRFQREHHGSFPDTWENTVQKFQSKYHKDIQIDEAFALSRKWKRYLIGAWNTIAAKNPNIEDWKKAAIEFEKYHRGIEERMMAWTIQNEHKFPLAKVKKPIRFQHGPYFNECVERVPKLFINADCYQLRPGIVLQVTSYDSLEKYIRLDFTTDIRQKIKPGVPINMPWAPLRADYVIYLPPNEIDDHLEFLGPLE